MRVAENVCLHCSTRLGMLRSIFVISRLEFKFEEKTIRVFLKQHETALHHAVQEGDHEECVKILLDHDIDVDVVSIVCFVIVDEVT